MGAEFASLAGPLEAEWDDLADRAGATPFHRPGWIRVWWEAFGDGALECVVVRRAGRVAALLPIVRAGATLRSPTNAHTPAFGVLAEDEGAGRELVDGLLAADARRIVLSHVDLASLGPWLRAGCDAARRTLVVTPVQRSPYLRLAGGVTAVARSFGSKRAAELRRRRRLLEREGRVRMVLDGAGADMLGLLAEGMRIEPSGWKADAGTAIVSRPETWAFYTEVARWAATRGWLRLAFLRLDERPLAFQLALEQGGVYYLVKCGHDPAYRRFGPGKLLVEEVIRYAAGAGLERFEFLGDDEPWKREWTSEARPYHLVNVFARGPLGVIASTATALYRGWARPLAKRILRRPRAAQPAGRGPALDLAGPASFVRRS